MAAPIRTAFQTAITKRLSNRWQAAATYTLSWLYDMSARAFSGVRPVPFFVQPDLGSDYSYSANDQRHRATLNGIWQVGRGFQLSGLCFYGSGQPITCSTTKNCGNYEVRESNANYGRPIPLLSLAYQPRMLQLGFRTTF